MMHLIFLYDPLCGWCYGAAARVEALARDARFHVDPLPSGLFGGDPTRRIDPAFAEHVVQADARIARLSGQPFSDAYRRNIVANTHLPFDSAPVSEALTAVAQVMPERELEALHALQRERYVHGRDIGNPDMLVLALSGTLGDELETWRTRLSDPALPTITQQRIARARQLMAAVGARGVPVLLQVLPGGGVRALPSELMLGGMPLADTLEPLLEPQPS